VRDLDYLGLLLFNENLIWSFEGQNQWKAAYAIFHYFACVFFLNPVITMTIATQLGQATLQRVVPGA